MPIFCMAYIYVIQYIYGKEFERFCVNLKKIVEFVEKLLYNESKLSKNIGNNGKVLA